MLPAYSEKETIRISFFGDEIEDIIRLNPVTGEVIDRPDQVDIYPAKHYVTEKNRMEKTLLDIETELEERLKFFNQSGRLLEAQRLEQRTRYDLEMLREVGSCAASKITPAISISALPEVRMDFAGLLPSNYLMVLDESHMMVPQIRGMYNGDRSRKEILVIMVFVCLPPSITAR